MVKKITFSILIVLFLVQFVFAIDTQLTIQTDPKTNIQIRISNPYTKEVLTSFLGEVSDDDGKIYVNFSVDRVDADVLTLKKQGGETTEPMKAVRKVPMGKKVFIDLTKENATFTVEEEKPLIEEAEIINETINETQTNASATSDSKLTGGAISNIGSAIKSHIKTIYYTLGIIVIAGAALFFVLKIRKSKKFKGGFPSYTEFKKRLSGDDEERIIKDAQQKIKQAQEQINQIIQKKSKVKELEERITKDRNELQRLKQD